MHVCVCVSMSLTKQVFTRNGGSHVNAITNQIAVGLANELKLKHKKIKDLITPALVRQHTWIFINSLVPNPDFENQTKDVLTTKTEDLGCDLTIPPKFIKNLSTSALARRVIRVIMEKEEKSLGKSDGKANAARVNVPKLEDANDAGTPNREGTVLILTEGHRTQANV